MGFETTREVYDATARNLRVLGLDVELLPRSFDVSGPINAGVYLLDPPWGSAFDGVDLDVSNTIPPIPRLLRSLGSAQRGDSHSIVVVKMPSVVSGAAMSAVARVASIVDLVYSGVDGSRESAFLIVKVSAEQAKASPL
ncbi:hypothetical protein [Phytoactinopolyspora endophytica]|uniref:hypothetical protein n=1 Tax=Phytoactinopolyspora endophytica TaxID=1642495 RepID=UPI00101D0848|nr:hypothetical protein [Phytoactinopolyspora endophytica]